MTDSGQNHEFAVTLALQGPNVLISTEFSCASSTLMHETGYGPGDRLGGRFHFLVFDPGTEFDRTAQAYFGLSPRRDGFGRHARSP
jgi:hypothetical protein